MRDSRQESFVLRMRRIEMEDKVICGIRITGRPSGSLSLIYPADAKLNDRNVITILPQDVKYVAAELTRLAEK